MAKKKTESKPNQELTTQEKIRIIHLRRFFPYLRKSYRELKKDELSDRETFEELFPNESFNPAKTHSVYEFQQLTNRN